MPSLLELVPDRTGVFEHPVVVTVVGARGLTQDTIVCTPCGYATDTVISRRPIAVLPGVVCPVCNAELCPS